MVLVLVLYKCTRTLYEYEYRLRFRPGSGVPLAQLAHQDIRCRGGTRGRGLITSTRTVRVLYCTVSLQNFVSGYIPEFQILYGNTVIYGNTGRVTKGFSILGLEIKRKNTR